MVYVRILSGLFFAYLISYSPSIEGAFQYTCNQVVIEAPVNSRGQPSNMVSSKDLEEIARLHVEKVNVFLYGASDGYLEDLAKCLRRVAPSATIVITSQLYMPGPYPEKPYETVYSELSYTDKGFTEKIEITAGRHFHCHDTVRELSHLSQLELVFIRLRTDDWAYINALEKYVAQDLAGKIIILKNVSYDNSNDYYEYNFNYKWTFE